MADRQITVPLSPELKQIVDAYAKKHQISINNLVRSALAEFFAVRRSETRSAALALIGRVDARIKVEE